jgi:hypothetical protein
VQLYATSFSSAASFTVRIARLQFALHVAHIALAVTQLRCVAASEALSDAVAVLPYTAQALQQSTSAVSIP